MAKMLATVSEDIEEGGHYLDQYSDLVIFGFVRSLFKLLNSNENRFDMSYDLSNYWVEKCLAEGKIDDQ